MSNGVKSTTLWYTSSKLTKRKGFANMTPNDLAQARQFVCSRPEYAWVCAHTDDFFTVSDLARYTGLSRESVRGLVENAAFPGAIRYSESIGWRIPRSGLIEYYARQLGWNAGQETG
jgi:predicted DNA-binding transcriptional regulator AlpA